MSIKAAPKKVGRPKKGVRGKSNLSQYSRYVYRVLKQVHPEIGVSNRAMMILNSFVLDIFERIASEAGRLARCP